MSKGKLTGIKRQTKYSPNHIGNDGTIYNLTAQCLRDMGYDVQDYTESEFVLSDIRDKYIFDMARDKSTIKWLKHLEDNGSVVINSAYGIENCT